MHSTDDGKTDTDGTSRRAVLATLASTGVLGALITQSDTAKGEPTFTPALNFYRGPLSDRPKAGDENRVWITQRTGAVYYDTGESWIHVNRDFRSLDVEELTVDKDAPGLTFVGIDADTHLKDEDPRFDLEEGVLIKRSDPEGSSYGSNRLVLGRDVYLGVRKSDELEGFSSNEGGSGELIKNPSNIPGITFENDFPDGNLNFESKGGGGFTFRTQDVNGENENEQIRRIRLTDPAGSKWDTHDLEISRLDSVRMGIGIFRLFPQGAKVWGPASLNILPGPPVKFTSRHTLEFNTGGYNNVLTLTGNRAKATSNFQLPIRSSPPADPEPGDVVIANGTDWDPDDDGNAEKVIYNGDTWIEDTDLETAL